jgi:DinB superfamily
MSEQASIEIPDATAEPQAYRAALLAMIGERDPLEVIAQTPRRIRALIDGRDPGALGRRPAADEWSVAEIVGHLLDVEIAMGFRWRMILTADRPAYPGYDEKGWAELPRPPLDQLLRAWEGLRASNLWLLRGIPRTAWSRVGVHSEVGPETIEGTIRAYAGHDLAHLNQLERALAG